MAKKMSDTQLAVEARKLASRIAVGGDPVRRKMSQAHFTYSADGKEVVFGDDIWRAVEKAAGTVLVELTPDLSKGDKVLRFADQALACASLGVDDGTNREARSDGELIKMIPQQRQRQDGTVAQLRTLMVMANRLGCYDAADVVRGLVERSEVQQSKLVHTGR